ncbi:galactokinase [candidate division KSB3 bacterium]|uniref:Galactokinase n=1 Tax=candidate division KSB3 bacterium TaxID=2044937 RepID=A0A2G6KF82_9BACT|nr:MAG: galactokinase [candidate division KSB3 bacterium]
MTRKERKTCIAQGFAARFEQEPTLWVQAPGRVDLMGSHTDYNEGFVMTMSIDRETWIALRPRDDRKVSIASLNLEGSSEFSLDDMTHDQTAPWTNYVRGVIKVLQERGYELQGFDGLIDSTIPFGSGLSSSAALEVATATAFKVLGNLDIDAVNIALLCQRAENEFVGMKCGILDQYSSALGEAGCSVVLDCRNLTHRLASIPEDISVVICDTCAKRELTGSEYLERRTQCETGARLLASLLPEIKTLRDVTIKQFEYYEADLPDFVAKRSRFIIEENQRVLDLAKALEQGDRERIAALTAESYAGARDLFGIGSPEMEVMMKAMRSAPGVIGARQTGAGFGGCMVAFVENGWVEGFAEHVQMMYTDETNIQPNVYPVQAASGAGVLSE